MAGQFLALRFQDDPNRAFVPIQGTRIEGEIILFALLDRYTTVPAILNTAPVACAKGLNAQIGGSIGMHRLAGLTTDARHRPATIVLGPAF